MTQDDPEELWIVVFDRMQLTGKDIIATGPPPPIVEKYGRKCDAYLACTVGCQALHDKGSARQREACAYRNVNALPVFQIPRCIQKKSSIVSTMVCIVPEHVRRG